MSDQRSFFGIEERLVELSSEGDPLAELLRVVDFEHFRPLLRKSLKAKDPSKGGRPGFDVVLKFKMLVLQAMHGLSLARTSYLVRDRLSWMRFCGLDVEDRVPDANTLWDFREALIGANILDSLFDELNLYITRAGYLPMSGQIIDATLVAAPRQRNTDEEKRAIKEGKVPQDWQDKPSKIAQKDMDARWTVKYKKAKIRKDGSKPPVDIAIPTYGYKNHISIDRRHKIIRRYLVTDAAAADGPRLREGLIDPHNTASYVWADTAYRSQENENHLKNHGKKSRIHYKKPKGKPMPAHIRRGNNTKSRIRARVEHVFAWQKQQMGLFIRTIGLARAKATVTFANMAYNMKRLCYLQREKCA